MKNSIILIAGLLFSTGLTAQGTVEDRLSAAFLSRTDVDFKFSHNAYLNPYGYYLSHDTLYYKQDLEIAIPLDRIDFATAVIREETDMQGEGAGHPYSLTLKPLGDKGFLYAQFAGTSYSDVFQMSSADLLFPSEYMAEAALKYLKDPPKLTLTNDEPAAVTTEENASRFSGLITGAKTDKDEMPDALKKIFAKRYDDDFVFTTGGGRTSEMQYYLKDDTLYFYGTELYNILLPLANIDFSRDFMYASGVYKTMTGEAVYEWPVYAKKGKLFVQDFNDEKGFMSVFKEQFGGKQIDFVSLLLPDKAFAEMMMKYLKKKAGE